MSTLINRKYWVKPCFEPHGFGLRTFVVEQSDSVKISASSVVPLILPGTAVPSSSAHSSSSFYGKRKIERVEEPSPNLILQLSKPIHLQLLTATFISIDPVLRYGAHQLGNFQKILSSMDKRIVDLHNKYIW